jgi:y4mF family transcriptional regulator
MTRYNKQISDVAVEPRATELITSPEDLGTLIRGARKRSGLTQQEFADLCGVGRRFLSESEAGKPRLELGKVLQVLKAAGIDLYGTPR